LSEFQDHWQLYRDPVSAGVLAGAVLGLVGVFVVLRRAVFVTAAISQAAGLGVAVAFFLSIHASVTLPPAGLAFVFGAGAALLVGAFPRAPREAVVGFTYLITSAGAIIVGDYITQEAHDVTAILFGTAVLVSPDDLLMVACVGALVAGVTLWARRGFLFAGLDRDAARVQGLPVRALDVLLWGLIAAEVSVTTRALGALPVFAFAVLPATAALGVARRLPGVLWCASIVGAVSGGVGYLMAFLLELPVGASQAVLCALTSLVVLAAGRARSPRRR
jgi:zinc transport system permease protein